MSNFLEKAGRRAEIEKDVQVDYTRIFYSAKSLLENKGKLVKHFGLFSHRVFEHVMHPREQEVRVKISSGADLEKANKISIEIQRMGSIEVRKKGVRGEETFSGKYAEENSGWRANMVVGVYGTGVVSGYSKALGELYKEMMPR